VRGIANRELTCELAMRIGRATAEVLSGYCRQRVLVGCDSRASSPMLCSALTAGLCAAGADVLELGMIPTPAVAYLLEPYGGDAGIVVSASHNPAEYNGIKIFGRDGCKLPDSLEERIEALVSAPEQMPSGPTGGDVGRMIRCSDAIRDYAAYLKTTVSGNLQGLRIAVDCANGATVETAKRLFAELGAEAVFLADAPDGVNINARCGSTHLENVQHCVVQQGLDAGVAFDGDGDRCLCVDETGGIVDGDMILALCAKDLAAQGRLPHRTVVGTVMTNFGFDAFCRANDLQLVRAKVGDRFVSEQMRLGGYMLGGEQSGHLIFREFATTGDGLLTALQVLTRMKHTGRKLSELASAMIRVPQVTVHLPVSAEGKLKFYTSTAVQEAISAAENALGETGRMVVRPSGTEPLIRIMAEGADRAALEAQAEAVAAVIRAEL
jgi:phosphoglucosamine mutase